MSTFEVTIFCGSQGPGLRNQAFAHHLPAKLAQGSEGSEGLHHRPFLKGVHFQLGFLEKVQYWIRKSLSRNFSNGHNSWRFVLSISFGKGGLKKSLESHPLPFRLQQCHGENGVLRLRGHFFLKAGQAGRPKWSQDPMAQWLTKFDLIVIYSILCENGIESMSLFYTILSFGSTSGFWRKRSTSPPVSAISTRFLSEVGPRGFASTLFVSSVKLVEVQGVPTTVKVENFASLITSIRIGYSNKHHPSGFPTISIHFQLSNGFLCTKTTTSNPISLDWFKGKSTGNHGFYH